MKTAVTCHRAVTRTSRLAVVRVQVLFAIAGLAAVLYFAPKLADIAPIGDVERRAAKEAEGIADWRTHVAKTEENFGPGHPKVMIARLVLGRELIDARQTSEGNQLIEDSVASLDRGLNGDTEEMCNDARSVATILESAGRREALLFYRRGLELSERTFGTDDKRTLQAAVYLAGRLRRPPTIVEAEGLYRRAIKAYDTIDGDHRERRVKIRYYLAETLHKQQKLEDAEGFFREAIKLGDTLLGELDSTRTQAVLRYADFLRESDRRPEARAMVQPLADLVARNRKFESKCGWDVTRCMERLDKP